MKSIPSFQYVPVQEQELAVDPKDLNQVVEPSAIVVGGASEINIKDVDLRQIERLLYAHPVIPRGIEIKANRMIGRGYEIKGPNSKYLEDCRKILSNSGDIVALKRWIEDGYAFGNGYLELIPNKAGTEILKVQAAHPIYFAYAKERKVPENRADIKPTDKLYIRFDAETKQPIGFQQYRYVNERMEPYGDIIPLNRVAHLAFDKWGDEIEGISIIKYLINIINYVLNIENAAAESGYRAANPRYKFTTSIRTREDLEEFASSVANINERDSVILTEGNDVSVLSPGNSNFAEYHDRFINLLAIRLGVPKPLLLMDGTSTNKATLGAQTDFIRTLEYADEAIVEQAIKSQIFEPALRLKYGDNIKDEDIPDFEFEEPQDEEDVVISRLKEKSLAIVNLTNAGLLLIKSGLYEEAKNVLEMIPKRDEYDYKTAIYEIDSCEPRALPELDEKPATNQNPSATQEFKSVIQNMQPGAQK